MLEQDEVNTMFTISLALTRCLAIVAIGWGIASGAPGVPLPRRATIVVSADERAMQSLVLLRQTEDSEGQAVRVSVSAGAKSRDRVLAFDCIPGEYIVRSRHLISSPIAIDARTCDSPRVATLFAAAVVRGRVAVEQKLPEANVVAVGVSPCRPLKPRHSLGTYRVRAAADGTFEAAVPADCLDMTVAVRGMAPSQVPRLSLTVGEIRQIGSYAFAPPALLRVSARSPAGDPLPGALVTVLAADEYDTYLRGLLRDEPPQSGEQRRADDRGHAEFSLFRRMLAYVVVRSGGLIGFGGPVDPAPGTDIPISVQVASRPHVTLMVAGDTSWIAGGGKLVALATPQVSGRWLPAAYRQLDWAESDSVSETLPLAGTWRFDLCMQEPGGLRRLEHQTIDLAAGADNLVQFSIERSRFEGRVAIGIAPRSGSLVVSQGGTGDEVVARVGEKGDFVVYLPRPGRYAAQFTSDDGVVRRAKGTAHFVSSDSSTIIRFPTTNVGGVVVLPDGSVAAGATVTAKPGQLDDPAAVQDPGFGVTADGGGAFAFQSLGYGDWEIGAILRGRAARPEIVNLTEGASVPALRLVLEEDRGVDGRVIDSAGRPLAAASGWISAEPTQPGEIPAVVQFQTDMQGYFHATLDRPARGPLQIALASPGYPATAFRVTPAGSTAVTLTVPQSGAEVRLILPAPEEAISGFPRDWNLYTLVNDQGALLPMNCLLTLQAAVVVPAQTSTTILIPALAPGTWRLAKFPDLRSFLLYLAGAGSLPELQRVVLAAKKAVSFDLRK